MIKEGGRKFTIAVLYFVLSTLMIVAGLLPSDNWMEYAAYVAMVYMTGNVGEWVTKRFNIGNKNETKN